MSTSSETSTAENRAASLRKTILVMSGGEGYVDFRLGWCICIIFCFYITTATAEIARNVDF